MGKITKLSKQNIKQVRDAIQSKLDEIGEELGLKMEMKGITYNDLDFRTKLEVKVLNGASDDDLELREFEKNCWRYNLTKEDYKKEIISDGEKLILTGFTARRCKYPLLAKKISTGQGYRLSYTVLEEKKYSFTEIK